MTVIRWILFVLGALLALGTAVSFAVFIGTGIDLWVERARIGRRWLWALALFWFNLEVWRRVVLIIIHW